MKIGRLGENSLRTVLLVILTLFMTANISCSCGPVTHPAYDIILENKTKQILDVYQNNYLLGRVEPGKEIKTMWDTHSTGFEIEAKSVTGELVFENTFGSWNLEKTGENTYKGLISLLQSK